MATTTAAAATTLEDLPADVLACALRRLDGRSLAAASCATTGLRALAADPDTWRALCLARWPSLLAARPELLSSALVSPQRLFADAFPFPCVPAAADNNSPAAAAPLAGAAAEATTTELPAELVSAVDVYHGGAPVLSRAVETSTSSSWFLASPFCVDAVECKSPAPIGLSPAGGVAPAELELSWVVIDPRAGGRAVNVSSRRPVAVDRHWYTGEALVRYAVVLGGCKFEATVTCSEEAGHIREITLSVEDADGGTVSGEGTLRLLAAAMAGPRKGGDEEQEAAAAKRRYEEFVRSKRGRKESKARKEVLVDLCCSAVSAVAVLSFIAAVVLR